MLFKTIIIWKRQRKAEELLLTKIHNWVKKSQCRYGKLGWKAFISKYRQKHLGLNKNLLFSGIGIDIHVWADVRERNKWGNSFGMWM
jgi:hypothetical protein